MPLSDERVVKELKRASAGTNPVGERRQALSQAIERFGACGCGDSTDHAIQGLRKYRGWTYCPNCGRRLPREVPHAETPPGP